MKLKYHLGLIVSLLLFSCNNNSEVKSNIPLFTSPITNQTIDGENEYLVNKIYDSELDYMIENKMSFPLFVYAAGCGTCDNFAIVMKDYIRLHQVVFPYMTLANYNLSKDKPISIDNSAILFFEEGKLVKTVDNVLEEVFSTSDLESLMDKYCYETNISYVSSGYRYMVNPIPFYSYKFTFSLNNIDDTTDNVYISNIEINDESDFSLLVINKSNFVYADLYKLLEKEKVDSFAITYNQDEKSLNETLKIDSLSPVMKITYSKGKSVSVETLSI